MTLIEAGAEVVVLRHPETLDRIRKQLDSWFAPNRATTVREWCRIHFEPRMNTDEHR